MKRILAHWIGPIIAGIAAGFLTGSYDGPDWPIVVACVVCYVTGYIDADTKELQEFL